MVNSDLMSHTSIMQRNPVYTKAFSPTTYSTRRRGISSVSGSRSDPGEGLRVHMAIPSQACYFRSATNIVRHKGKGGQYV
jgi:hypothetical protein